MSSKQIAITCDTKLTVPPDQLHGIQDTLKILTRENFEKLRRQIISKGVNFALHVWKQTTKVKGKKVVKFWVIDGHGRLAVIKHLVEMDGFQVGPLPCVEIQAANFNAAKEQVLAASSSYHTMTEQGLYEFQSGLGLTMEQLKEYTLPEIDLPNFEMQYFGQPEAEPEAGEGKHVSFDAYQNAAVKQIVLYFAKDEYEKVIAALDRHVEADGLEDYSQVIWKLLRQAEKA